MTTTRTSAARDPRATSRRPPGLDQLPWYRKTVEHPAYDAFWKEQALDKTMAAQPLKVPTMWIQGIWDQEDMWGGIHSYLAVEPKDATNTMNFSSWGRGVTAASTTTAPRLAR